MTPNISRESLKEETDKVLEAITSPHFIKQMPEFRKLKGEERVLFAQKNMTPSALEANGVPISQDMRVSSRTFEEDFNEDIYVDYDKASRIIQGLQKTRPELLEKLKKEHPEIYSELGIESEQPNFFAARMTGIGPAVLGTGGAIGGPRLGGGGIRGPRTGPLGPGGIPTRPGRGPFVPGEPSDPLAAWACACGGAATACGGAGGGS